LGDITYKENTGSNDTPGTPGTPDTPGTPGTPGTLDTLDTTEIKNTFSCNIVNKITGYINGVFFSKR
jgi:hypothetical protein